MPLRRQMRERAVADPVHVAQRDGARLQRLARADDDLRLGGVEPHDEERLAACARHGGAEAEAAPLADRVMNDAGVAAQHAAVDMDDLAGHHRAGREALDDIGVMAARARSRCPGCRACRRRRARSGGRFRAPRSWCSRRAESAAC